MKILELRFKNLNSLYGEWCIDFRAPEYSSDGIFALIGPTGAGKSTVLDAICLALYGETPRLGKITKSTNEIMSRQTGECYAEVLFSSQAGTFRCHFEQRCARRKAGGKLQDTEHQIIDGITNIPLETKKSKVIKVVEEKTGMDFGRFTRSMLLAQGGFDNFLKADIEQKSKILEQITGTQIYTNISKQVHARATCDKEKLKVLEKVLADISIIEPAKEKELQDSMLILKEQEQESLKEQDELNAKIAWHKDITNLAQEVATISNNLLLNEKLQKDFAPQAEKLELAVKAATIKAEFATLTQLRNFALKNKQILEQKTKDYELYTPKIQTQTELLATYCASKELVNAEYNKNKPLIETIILKDNTISALNEQLNLELQQLKQEEHELTDTQNQQKDANLQQQELSNEKLALEKWLTTNKNDAWLVEHIFQLQERFNALSSLGQDIANSTMELALKQQEHASFIQTIAIKEKELAAKSCAQTKKQNLVNSLIEQKNMLLNGKLLREYIASKDSLNKELNYIKQVNELQELRDRLVDGKSCPLCGSLEHPYALKDNINTSSKEDEITALEILIKDIEQTTEQLDRAEKDLAKHSLELKDCEHKCANVQVKIDNIATQIDAILQVIADNKNRQTINKDSIYKLLEPLGIKELELEDLQTLFAKLSMRLTKWNKKQQDFKALEERFSLIALKIASLNAKFNAKQDAIAQLKNNFNGKKINIAALQKERFSLYQERIPQDERYKFEHKLENANRLELQAQTKLIEFKNSQSALKGELKNIKNGLDDNQKELTKNTQQFKELLVEKNFANESAYISAILEPLEQERLESRNSTLNKSKVELELSLKDRKDKLAQLQELQLTFKNLDELQELVATEKVKLLDLQNKIANISQTLLLNENARTKFSAKVAEIDLAKIEYERSNGLNQLIGSFDGKKYRNFAQGLTFEIMLMHANLQLEKMSDRYLLLQDPKQPLELNVIDNYQAGEIRSIKNLSGGESFIVSLALALGLSKMASQKVRVDSLFLDEGFGSLDNNALEMALDALANIEQDNKLIGIISHVGALQERITTQIAITPAIGGRSALNGPGCSKLA